jgi:hypothetical protein
MERFVGVGRGVLDHDLLTVGGKLTKVQVGIDLLKKVHPDEFIEF